MLFLRKLFCGARFQICDSGVQVYAVNCNAWLWVISKSSNLEDSDVTKIYNRLSVCSPVSDYVLAVAKLCYRAVVRLGIQAGPNEENSLFGGLRLCGICPR